MVRGGGYEPILSKQTMLDMNLIQILDSDHLSVVKIDSDPLLDEYADVFEGLGKLAGQYEITVDETIKPVAHPPPPDVYPLLLLSESRENWRK